MIFMPPYLKLHLIFIALLTHGVLRLTMRCWDGSSAHAQCGSTSAHAQCGCLLQAGPGEGGECCWGWCQFQDTYAMSMLCAVCCDPAVCCPLLAPFPALAASLCSSLCPSFCFEIPLPKRALLEKHFRTSVEMSVNSLV